MGLPRRRAGRRAVRSAAASLPGEGPVGPTLFGRFGRALMAVLALSAAGALLGPPAAAAGSGSRHAQAADTTGTVAGRVLGRDAGEPLAGAEVELSVGEERRTAVADGAGRFRFGDVPSGRHAVRAVAPGYRPQQLVVTVRPGDTVRVEFSLARVDREERRAVILGQVLNARTGEPVAGAGVRVRGTAIGAFTDSLGRYGLEDVPPGRQTLVVRRLGFAVNEVTVQVPGDGAVHRDIEVGERALEVEGIEVTVQPGERAVGELGTASVIDQQALRHQTATSLGGVLSLVPGVETSPPGLGSVQQVSLRGVRTTGAIARATGRSASELASTGTVVILNGVPVSNNANLQSTGPRGELSFTTSAGGGVDLRRVPASTLERVSVLRGVPSARWGDLTQGAIIVDTQAGEVAPEVTAQYDARTGEVSAVAGRSLGGGHHTGTLTFDVARTRIRPGITDDRAYRVAGRFAHRYESAPRATGQAVGQGFRLDSRVNFFRLGQRSPPNPNVPGTRTSRSEDIGVRLTEDAELWLDPGTRVGLLASYTRLWQDDFVRTQRLRTAMPFTDRLTEGRSEGFYVVGPYTSELRVEGRPSMLFSRLELDARRDWLGVAHRLRAGAVLRREGNDGDGRQFDISRPPQVTFNGVQGFDRPRSFESIPALATSALYVDDRLRAELGGTVLEAQAGLRLGMLHAGSDWLSGVRDVALQPRVNVRVAPLDWLALTAGAGRVANAPGLRALYPAPQYYDVVNVNYYLENHPDERLAVLTTFIEDPSNPELGFTDGTKLEVGVEFGVGEGRVELVAFRDRIDGGVGIRNVPVTIRRERFALTDSVPGNGVKPEIIEPPKAVDPIPVLLDRPSNLVRQTSRGFELVGLLPRIPELRTRFQVTGSWVWTRQSVDAPLFGSSFAGTNESFSDFQINETDRRHPYWRGLRSEGESGLLTYRAIHQQPDAGLVLTATVQHNVYDEVRDLSATDTLAFAGYIDREGDLVQVPRSERGARRYDDLRVPRGGVLEEPTTTPGDWMLHVQLSKTLPVGGRLNFWAFNVLDDRGVPGGPDTLGRFYSSMRFGVEARFRPAELFGNGWGQ